MRGIYIREFHEEAKFAKTESLAKFVMPNSEATTKFWFGKLNPSEKWRILGDLRKNTPQKQILWQYFNKPVYASPMYQVVDPHLNIACIQYLKTFELAFFTHNFWMECSMIFVWNQSNLSFSWGCSKCWALCSVLASTYT